MTKYRNRLTLYAGRTYHSAAEAARAAELHLLQRAGEISDLREQVEFVLLPAGKFRGSKLHKRSLIVDFVYVADRVLVIEDVKGGKATQTPLFRHKWEHLQRFTDEELLTRLGIGAGAVDAVQFRIEQR